MKPSRRDEILRILGERGKISIEELSEAVYASSSTVRRELTRLEQQGLVRRYHGGVSQAGALMPPKTIRETRNQAEKAAVAEKAARLISEGETVFIDASSTVQYMIAHLSGIKRLTVYTNGADTAMRLSEAGVRAISVGGELLAESMAYVGAIAEACIRRVRFDAAFLSAAGFDGETVSDWSEAETVLRRTVIECSERCYLLFDHSKLGKRYTHVLCQRGELDGIICE